MWSNGPAVRAWASDKAVKSSDKIQIIGSGMFGTYAYHIPTLLEESYGGAQRLNNITSPTFVAEEEVDGVRCYRIRGTWVGDEYEIWLGTVDNIVRKITAKYRDHQLEETHRDISVNQPIPTEKCFDSRRKRKNFHRPSPHRRRRRRHHRRSGSSVDIRRCGGAIICSRVGRC